MAKIKVTYVDSQGSDHTVTQAARVCFGKSTKKLTDKDKKLIAYLAKNKHLSPFEHCTLTVIVECPLYIRSQIHRHRTFSYNEISRRYTSENIEFYLPEDIRIQAKDDKQASRGSLTAASKDNARYLMDKVFADSYEAYLDLLALGVCREQARSVLPQATMTKFYMTGNLRNFIHFLKLRLDGHAQKEARDVASQILAILKERFPISVKELMEHAE
jgi:thymidylate synthase (FAD)